MGSGKHTARIGKPVRARAPHAADAPYYGVKEVKSFRFQVEFTLY